MSDETFDATAELQQIRSIRKKGRKEKYYKRKLMPYRAEIVLLKKEGGTLREIEDWLRVEKNLEVSHTTVKRYLDDLPEMEGHKDG